MTDEPSEPRDEETSEPEPASTEPATDSVAEPSQPEPEAADDPQPASVQQANPLGGADAEPLSAQLGFLGRIDNWVYRAEVVVVVAALVLMSVMVFTDVVYQLAVGISQYLDRGDARAYQFGGAILGFVALIAFAATGDNRPAGERIGDDQSKPLPVRIGVTAGAVFGSILFCWMLLHWESSTVYRLVAVLAAVPIGRAFWRSASRRSFASFAVGTVLALLVFGQLPTGYSWSQSYSLILLLWVSFLGASVAARERRHLRVDLARKLLSPAKLPWFNAASYTVAALFTAVVFYLGFIYMFGPDSTYLRPIWDPPTWLPESLRTTLSEDFPLPEDASFVRRALQVVFAPSEPGELPDWLKVAAIPVSMGFIFLRFIGHAFVFARMGMRGEEFVEQAGTH